MEEKMYSEKNSNLKCQRLCSIMQEIKSIKIHQGDPAVKVSYNPISFLLSLSQLTT